MEERFITGFCRQVDQSRMVSVETEHGALAAVDCSYETCVHRAACEIGKAITELLEQKD